MASVGHFLWTKYEIQSVEQKIVSLREPRDEKLALERDIAKLTKQIAENTVSLTEQVIQRRELQLLTERSDRYADLLKQLAITCDQDIVVDDIKPSVKGIRLSGRALKSESPNMLAIALGPKALQMGWSVSPPILDRRKQAGQRRPLEIPLRTGRHHTRGSPDRNFSEHLS